MNFPFLDGDVPKRTSYGIYISQLVRFARACTRVEDFNSRNLSLTTKLLKQGFRYHKLCKMFKSFFRKNNELIVKYGTTAKSLIRDGVCLPEFYGDFVYKLRKIVKKTDFSNRFESLVKHFIKKGYKKDLLRNTSYLVVDPFKVRHFAHLF